VRLPLFRFDTRLKQTMERQPVVIVNRQEVIPASQVPAAQAVQVMQPVRPVQSHVIQRAQVIPVQYSIPWDPRVVMYRRGKYVFLVNEPPILQCRSTLESWHIVAAFLALLVLLVVALGTILVVSLAVSGQL
jgi:hypothetical protein